MTVSAKAARAKKAQSASGERDSLTTGFAFALAGASVIFASYMTIAGPDGPDLPAASASVEPLDPMDRLTTASLARTPRQWGAGRAPGGPLYRIVAVAGGRAYLEMDGDRRNRLMAVSPGMTLAGLGRVLSVTRAGNRWIVRTTSATLIGAADPQSPK